jgi:predicted transposase YdaD
LFLDARGEFDLALIKKTIANIFRHILKQHPDLRDRLQIFLRTTEETSTRVEETSIRFEGDFSNSYYGPVVEKAFRKALALDHCLPEWIVRTEGMSGKKYRYFINNLIRELEYPR